ncbi:MAG: pentapeptide repeat-containing protein, partial [Pseudomonadota bacterium]
MAVGRAWDFSQHLIYVAAALAAIFGILAYLAEADDRDLERQARLALLTNNAWQTLTTGTSTQAQTQAFQTLMRLGINFDDAEIPELQLASLDLEGETIADFRTDEFAFLRMQADGITFRNWARKSPQNEPKKWRVIGSSLRGATLAGSLFVFTRFEDTDLEGANLQGTDLLRSTFERVNLKNADLSDTWLVGTQFIDVDLRGANLSGAKEKAPFILAPDPSFERVCLDATTVMPDWYNGEIGCPAAFFTDDPAYR